MPTKSSTHFSTMVQRILESLASLESDLANLHLTTVAKAIEHQSGEKQRIIFRAKPKRTFESQYPSAVTLTQEITVTLPGCDSDRKMYEHFVYYPAMSGDNGDEKDLQAVRLSIAHELGHIFLHMPRTSDKDHIYIETVPGAKDIYSISFSSAEETEADLFAAIVCEARCPPLRHPQFRRPCIRRLTVLKEQGLLKSDLPKIVPSDCSAVMVEQESNGL